MKVLVVGKTGQLGRELEDYDWSDSFRLVHLSRNECDLADPNSIQTAVLAGQPDIVVNAAAYTAVDKAESEPDVAMRINGEGPNVLARCCSDIGSALVHVSTDYVFDGTKVGAYCEHDRVNPLSVYGRSKLAGEEAIRKLCPRHAIIRTSWVFSRHGNNFVKTMLRLGARRDELGIVRDQTGAPTSARDIAHAIAAIVGAISAGSGKWGTFHYASAEPTSWFGFAQAIFAVAKPQKNIKVLPITSEQFGAPARRPANSVLDCARIREAYGIEQPSWQAALEDTLNDLVREGTPS